MLDRETQKQVDVGMRNLRLIWGALMLSLLIYVFVAIYAKGTIKPNTYGNFPSTLRWILYLVSVLTFILAYYIRKMLITSKRALKGWTQTTGNRQNPAVVRYSTAVVIILAVSESIGIYGLILYFFFGKLSDLTSLTLFSAIAMILYRPRQEELIELIRSSSMGFGGKSAP